MRLGVVGGGVIGLAAAWQAARRGHSVSLFEAGAVPNRQGASWDEHRLSRIPYGNQDGYARMMPAAMAAWMRAFAAMGATHYAETGCLALCTAEGDWTDRSRASLQRLGVAHRILDRAELGATWPLLRCQDAHYGLWTAQAGVLFADRITEGFASLARQAGVVLHGHAQVSAVEDDGRVIAAGKDLRFDAVLVAAGAWTAQLLPWIGDRVTTLRQVVVYCIPPSAQAAAWAAAPILLDMGGAAGPRGMFAAPPVAGRGLKLGCGGLNHPADPDGLRVAGPDEAARTLAAWRERLADFSAYRIASARVCFYARSTDEAFVVERRGRVLGITGCSGHAFKFAALLAEDLPILLEGDDSPLGWMRGQG